MNFNRGSEDHRPNKVLNLALVGLLGQVGVITLVIVILAAFGGLWMDNHFMTRPLFTLIFLIASIPVSLIVMLKIVRYGLSKLNIKAISNNQAGNKEDELGKNK